MDYLTFIASFLGLFFVAFGGIYVIGLLGAYIVLGVLRFLNYELRRRDIQLRRRFF